MPSSKEGQRLDNFLLPVLKIPRSLLYKSLRKGDIRLNSGKIKPCHRIKSNDIISVWKHLINTKSINDEAERKNRQNKHTDVSWLKDYIIENNKSFMVFNKPSGLAVHGGSGHALGLIEMARLIFKDENWDLELVHRLDKDTSGLILVSKKRSALRALSELFATRNISKTYYAVLNGTLKKKTKVLDKLKTVRSKDGIRRAMVDQEEGKDAHTIFTPQLHENNKTLCKIDLKTGRMHQIRAHAQSLNLPVLGDKIYTMAKFKGPLHLHAWKLEFKLDTQAFVFVAPLPENWSITGVL